MKNIVKLLGKYKNDPDFIEGVSMMILLAVKAWRQRSAGNVTFHFDSEGIPRKAVVQDFISSKDGKVYKELQALTGESLDTP